MPLVCGAAQQEQAIKQKAELYLSLQTNVLAAVHVLRPVRMMPDISILMAMLINVPFALTD